MYNTKLKLKGAVVHNRTQCLTFVFEIHSACSCRTLNEQIVRFQPKKVINIGQFFYRTKMRTFGLHKQRLTKKKKKMNMSNLLINKLKRLKSESIRPQTLPRARALREPLILRSRRGIHNGSGPVKQLRRTAVLLDVLEHQNSLYSLLLKQQVISIRKPLFLLGRTV